MSKKKKKSSNTKASVKDENVKVEKQEVKEEKQKITTVVDEDKSFEKLFEKEISEKKVKDKEKLEKYKEEKALASEREKKVAKHPFVHAFLVLVLLTSLAYFIVSLFYNDTDSLSTLINSLLLVIFTILFVSVSITTNRKNKTVFFVSSFILFSYFVFGVLLTTGFVSFPNTRVIDFTGKELTEVIKWSEKNKIDIIQDYEFSDMIDEYHIIGQDVKPGTKIKDVETITVAVSEGPSPSKEVVIPNMVSWDDERVLKFIKENHLSNVIVEFVESTKPVDTVIEQSKSGNMRRDEELKLTFSYGMELEFSEVKLKDLTGMSEFEATFYLKQHHLNYEFEEVFSSNIKKGYVVSQSVKAGERVKINGDKIVVSISKGPEIKVPNLKGMTMTEITEWVISNKLKLEFTDKYDDSIKENSVISANYKEGDIIAEGSVVEVVISRGKLTMPKFESFEEFRDWADKYEITYDEQHEFSGSVEAGQVIRYSYGVGETIKNNDSIVVVISDGKEAEVPNVVGSTKSQATTKLKNAGFNYNFVYKCSNSVSEGKAISQSIRAGSKVAQGTSVTVTLSSGKCASSSSSGNSGGSSSGGGSSTPSKPATPTCDTSKGAVFWDGSGGTGTDTFKIMQNQNPGFTIVPTYVDSCPNGSTNSGEVCSINITPETWVSYCTTVRVTIVR